MLNYKLLKDALSIKMWWLDLWDLQVVIDFDGTATKFDEEMKQSNTIIGQIRNSNVLGPAYSEESDLLFRYYSEISLKPRLSDEVKSIFMTWWRYSHLRLFSKYKLNESKLKDIVENQNVLYRDWFILFLRFLYEKKIPITIVSAASSFLIQQFLQKENAYYSNINIVSNQLYPTDLVVNSFNKKVINIRDFPLTNDVLHLRKKVLLLGDSIQDAAMADSLDYQKIFKIAFIKTPEEHSKYSPFFDLLLVDDFDYSILINSLQNFY